MLKGIAASNGIGIGKIRLIEYAPLEYTPKTVTDTQTETQRFTDAIAQYSEAVKKQAEAVEQAMGKNEAAIIKAHMEIIKDPVLLGETKKLIKSGQCAEAAFDDVCNKFISVFSSSCDEPLKQRAEDITDIRTGVIRILLNAQTVEDYGMPERTVIVARELTPSMTASLDKKNIVGIITETGNTASHSAIFARALEIPAVLSVPDIISKIKDGDTVIVDGTRGEISLSPSESEIKCYDAQREVFLKQRQELERFRYKPTLSASGEKYDLYCNLASPEDALKAIESDGEGAGLFRTEFLFMNENTPPSEEKQFQAYRRTALMLKGKPLTIRTIDIGGDKPAPCLNLQKEENPMLGLRAIRYCLKNRDIFKTQLRAILRASAYGKINIMFPLIVGIDELREGKKILAEIRSELQKENITFDENIKIGIMVETASAAVMADVLAKEADFFSIGTNDLTGYTLSCDRNNSDTSYLYSVFQPSVLRLIKYTIACANKNNIPVGMCGEAAADPRLIPMLISFGLTEFSVSPPSVLMVRKCISEWTREKANKIEEDVMKLKTRQEIEEYLHRHI